MKIKEWLGLKWNYFNKNPVINPPFLSSIIADPTFVTPEQSPDNKWHIFAHSIFGIHHYESFDGIKYKKLKLIVNFGVRPFIFINEKKFLIFYEKVFSLFRFPFYDYRLEVIESDDLYYWSNPKVILKPNLVWHKSYISKGTVGGPSVFKFKNRYILIYTGGLKLIKNCLFTEARYGGVAKSSYVNKNYLPDMNPINENGVDFKINKNNRNIPSRVYKIDDGYIGLQTMFYNSINNKPACQIKLLYSKNGDEWFENKKFKITPDCGWKSDYVYVGDMKIYNNKVYIYFNARNGQLIGKECIGLVIGE